VGWTDWRQLTEQLEAAEAKLVQLRNETAELEAQGEALEARSLEREVESNTKAEAIRRCENRAAQNREQIAARESSVELARDHANDLQDTLARHRRQLTTMTGRAGDLQQRLRDTGSELQQAEHRHTACKARVESLEADLERLTRKLDSLRGAGETLRQSYLGEMRAAASLGQRISGLSSRLETAGKAASDARTELADVERRYASCQRELEQAEKREREMARQRDTAAQALEQTQRQLADQQQQRTHQGDRLAGLKQRFSGVHERVSLLEELDRNQEGLAAGVREVLDLAREAMDGPFAEVQGLVADLIQAAVDVAPLVDVALGDKAQHLVVDGPRLLDDVQSGQYEPAGRVGFIPLDVAGGAPQVQDTLTGQTGVVGRLDRLVTSDARYEPLVRRLLSNTWCVDSLARALSLRTAAGSGVRFVTASGEMVEGDGTVLVGTRLGTTGLVSRRSELRDLQQEMTQLEGAIQQGQHAVTELAAALDRQQQLLEQRQVSLRKTETTLAEQRLHTRALSERREHLQRRRSSLKSDLESAVSRSDAAERELNIARQQLAEREQRIATQDAELEDNRQDVDQAASRREELARQATADKVELAKSEQHLDGLRVRMSQLEEDQAERSRTVLDSRNQLETAQRQLQKTEREILAATSQLAQLYLHKDAVAKQADALRDQQDVLAQQRTEIIAQLQDLRQRQRKLEEQQHRCDLETEQVRHQRSTLADRLREDYEIEISDLQQEATPQEQAERESVETEIAELRRKINNIGAVNVDALAELDELEVRFGSLSSQYQDLSQAKESLERIIQRINTDSRRLFQETLEAIRVNFQSLYRKAFGGGRADLVLEEGVDVLEAGVEIIATPPGKPSFNNSLLSGGEKALTAVSLLLAIFQYRPSPFCVLDEVDAPFDEANIGRFIEVLKSFLGWTKFVIVTHSKKTMTAATTLYGVTMQESGVSKRVSVRFEDVTEDGHILEQAVERQEAEDEEDERGAA
jgi:chromosome segregation protein